MSLSSFFSSFLNVVHADAEEKEVVVEPTPAEEVEQPEVVEEAVAEPEPEEPEDSHPIIRDECKTTAKCAPLARHFEHCQEKVAAGEGFKGEDCVEEFMMHCVDACSGPKLFPKLK